MNINLIKKQLIDTLEGKGIHFISNLLRLCNVKATDEDTIAYVKTNDNSLTIYTGKQFEELSYFEKQGVLLHEVLHIPQLKEMSCFTFDYSKLEAKLEGDVLIEFQKRENLFLLITNTLNNYGLDADVNTTVQKLGFILPEGCITPENLSEAIKANIPAPKRGEDFVTFVQYCFDEADVEIPPLSSGSGDGEGELSDIDPDILDSLIEEATKRAVEQAKKGDQNEEDAKLCGRVSGKNLMKVKQEIQLPRDIVKQLEVVRRRLKAIRGDKEVFAYTWSRRHKSFPNKVLPRLQKEKFIKRTEKVVIVMDSSGSAWSNRNFELGVAIVNWFEKQNLLGSFWCCDTELFKVEKDKRNYNEVVGGGGTEFNKRHVEQIVKDTGEDISILYLTDGELDLRDANDRKDTHVLVCF